MIIFKIRIILLFIFSFSLRIAKLKLTYFNKFVKVINKSENKINLKNLIFIHIESF